MRWCELQKYQVRTAPEYRPDGVIPDKYRRLSRVEGRLVSFSIMLFSYVFFFRALLILNV